MDTTIRTNLEREGLGTRRGHRDFERLAGWDCVAWSDRPIPLGPGYALEPQTGLVVTL